MKKLTTKKGAVLIMTFIIMITITIIVSAFLFMTSTGLRATAYDVSSQKAFWISGAGIEHVRYRLKNDPAYISGGAQPFSGSAPLNYSVTADISSDPYIFTSRGTVNGITRRIDYSIPKAFFYPLYYDQFGHLDSGITFQNGQPQQGSVPSSMDLSYYQSIAPQAQNKSGNWTFQAGGTYSGIWYIDNSATIEDNVTINGSIIAKNGITFTGNNINVVTTLPYPALMTNGNLNINMNSLIAVTGLVYVGGNLIAQKDSNSSFTGTVIVGQGVQYQGAQSVTITYDVDVVANPPPGFDFPGAGGSYNHWHEVVPAT